MSIDLDTVRHVARLARIEMDDAELAAYTDQLQRILDLMTRLKAVPTEGVEPMSHAVAMEIPQREDAVTGENRREALLACAPEAEEGHFRVPKVVE